MDARAEPPAPVVCAVSSSVDVVRGLCDVDDGADGAAVVTGRGLLEPVPHLVEDAPVGRRPCWWRRPEGAGRVIRCEVEDFGHELLHGFLGSRGGGMVDERERSDAILSSSGVAEVNGVPGFPLAHR